MVGNIRFAKRDRVTGLTHIVKRVLGCSLLRLTLVSVTTGSAAGGALSKGGCSLLRLTLVSVTFRRQDSASYLVQRCSLLRLTLVSVTMLSLGAEPG